MSERLCKCLHAEMRHWKKCIDCTCPVFRLQVRQVVKSPTEWWKKKNRDARKSLRQSSLK